MENTAEDEDEELDVLASQASRYGLRLGKLPMQEVAGTLRVRVVSGFGLAAADKHVMSESTSDPYVILKLKDDASYFSERMTYPKEMTLNPEWGEEFKFGVRKATGTLYLQTEVMDDNNGKRGAFLGKSGLTFTMQELSSKADEWLEFSLPLKSDNRRSIIKAKGQIVLRIYWEPWAGLGLKMITQRVLQSRKACGIVGALLTLCMSPLLLVAADSRWLCQGTSLHSCTPITSGARQAATDVASYATRICGLVHFFGAMGMFGTHWRTGFPRIFELVEDEDQDSDNRKGLLHPDSLGGADEKGLDLHLLIKPMGPRDISFNLGVGNLKDVTSKTAVMMLRYTAWVAHFVALAMLTLALSIVIYHSGTHDIFLAEGAYLTMFIDAVLFITLYLLATNSRRGEDLKRDDDLPLADEVREEAAKLAKRNTRKAGKRQVALKEPLIEP